MKNILNALLIFLVMTHSVYAFQENPFEPKTKIVDLSVPPSIISGEIYDEALRRIEYSLNAIRSLSSVAPRAILKKELFFSQGRAR